MAEATKLAPAPLRSPVFDRAGRMTAEWQRYFMQLFTVSQNVASSLVTITESVADVEGSGLLDSRNPQDAAAIAEEAAAGVPSDTPRDFTPLIEEALFESLAPSAKDFSPEIEAAVRSVVESVPQVTRADLDELNARLVMIESVNRGSAANASTTDFDATGAAEEIARQQAQQLFKDFSPEIEAAVRAALQEPATLQVTRADLDELRVILAANDVPRMITWLHDIDAGGYSLSNLGGLTGGAFGNLTEATSAVLTILNGSGAVIGNVSIQVKQASGSQPGYLSSSDWTTFNNKQSALSPGNLTEATSAVLTITGGTGAVLSSVSIQVKQASATQSGYLSSSDWQAVMYGPLMDARTPRVVPADLEEVTRALILDASTPRVTPADLDEMRTLIASMDVPVSVPTNWGTWTPTLTAFGSMSVSSPVVNFAFYMQIGQTVWFSLQCTCTLGGTASQSIFYTLPILPSNAGVTAANLWFQGYLFDNTQWANAFAYWSSANGGPGLIQPLPNGTNMTLGAGVSFGVTGFYRIS